MSSAYDIVMSDRKAVVDKLISQMEKGYATTRAAWSASATGRPYNPISDAVYKGGNRFRLMLAAEEQGFSDPRWMTFKQASAENYKIAPGSKGVLLEKWIFYKEVPKLDEKQKPVIGADGKPEVQEVLLNKPIVNYFRVFNGEQIIGLPELEHREVTEDDFSKMAAEFEKSSKCPIRYENQDQAYYSPIKDEIHLPPKHAFKNNETRLSVLLHEMAHSTGHETRLNRPLVNKFGSVEYAKEELNAELSSVFLENELGISLEADSELLKDHANYVKNWIAVLKDNPNELFVACANADRITAFLMENYEKELEKNMEVEKQKVTVAIESTKDYSDPKVGFYTYNYQDGREGIRYRLVTLGDDGFLHPYLDDNAFFINRTHINEYIDTHADQLNVIGYDDMVYQAGAKQIELQVEANYRITQDIEQSGLKASPKLIHNIYSFEQMEGREYSMRDLRELMKSDPDFSNQPNKSSCFEAIVSECKEQESVKMLESRYEEAMQILGYEQSLEDPVAKDGFLVFENKETGEKQLIDGWHAVGEYIEEVQLPVGEERAYFEKLIHPEGRLEYYTKLPEADVKVEVYKNFEEAYSAYDQAGFMDGKSLGFSIEGRTQDLIWFDSRTMEHNLFRASRMPQSYAPECTVNELRELEVNTKQVIGNLQKENAYIQLSDVVTNIEMEMVSYFRSGEVEKVNELTGRFVSERRPQDYFDIKVSDGVSVLLNGEEKLQKRLTVSAVHANGIIDEKSIMVDVNKATENGIREFSNSNEEMNAWMKENLNNLDTDFMAYGQQSFAFYSTNGIRTLEDHYEKLENAGYTRYPSVEQYIHEEMEQASMEEDVWHERQGKIAEAGEKWLKIMEEGPVHYEKHLEMELERMREARISEEISKSGFKPEKSLIKNISRFEVLCERKYTMRELAQLSRQKQAFTGERKECFNKIVTECQKQEMELSEEKARMKPDVNQENSIKQEMMMEHMQIQTI